MASKEDLVKQVGALHAELRAAELALREAEIYQEGDLVECFNPHGKFWEPGRVVEVFGDDNYAVCLRRVMGRGWMRRLEEIVAVPSAAEGAK